MLEGIVEKGALQRLHSSSSGHQLSDWSEVQNIIIIACAPRVMSCHPCTTSLTSGNLQARPLAPTTIDPQV